MSLRLLFIVLLILQLPAYAALMVITFRSNLSLFYLAEALLIVDILFLIFFYKKILSPLRTLRQGLELLKSQDWNMKLTRVGQREIDEIADVFNSMMEMLHRREVSLREQRNFLSLLVEASPAGVVVCSFDGKVIMHNPVAAKFLETNDAASISRLLPEEDETVVDINGRTLRFMQRHFIEDGVPHNFYIIEDLTRPISEATKDAYRRVIRVMAHEVNNTVAGLDTALATLPADDSDSAELIDSCRHRVKSLSSFIGKFAEVVKLPRPVFAALDLAALVSGMKPFLAGLCAPRNIDISYCLPDAPVYVDADAAMIEQVIVNIVKNAAESIGSDGNIIISLDASLRRICVCDNGPGIDDSKALKIFSPFFTDKPGGRGIGLTFVKEVLVMHNCSYSLTTDHKDGLTRFIFRF